MSSPRKKLFLTGASGLLGANALYRWQNQFDCLGVYRSHPIRMTEAKTLALDLTDTQRIKEVLNSFKPDVIVHAAALSNIDACETNRQEGYLQNVSVTEYLATEAEELKCQFVFISTDAFFDEADKLFTEDDEPRPINYYGETKAKAERIVLDLPKGLCIRTNFFGWNYQDKKGLAEWVLHSLKSQTETPLFKDVFFSPLFVDTLAKGISHLIHDETKGIMNVAGENFVSKLEFGTRLAKLFELNATLIRAASVKDSPLKAKRSRAMGLSVKRLKARYPQLDLTLENGLKSLADQVKQGYPYLLKGKTGKGLDFLTLGE